VQGAVQGTPGADPLPAATHPQLRAHGEWRMCDGCSSHVYELPVQGCDSYICLPPV
jgi:hypothetical protein